jgi:pyruvate/2-oxoglutarate dehydrogenase complex dihydrolipoamide acyltransferase (E2) component
MNKNYTTHLICAPDLPHAVAVALFHVEPGQVVPRDTLLLTLECKGKTWPILAPESGEISSFMVEMDEEINTGDLLLLMEIEEAPTGFLVIEPEHETPPTPRAPTRSLPSSALKITPAAAKLAARLGVDLSEVAANGLTGEIGESEVEQHVREVLLRWQQLKQWVNR